MFYKGQKVVCVNNGSCTCGICSGYNPLTKDEIYTVLSSREYIDFKGKYRGITLVEIKAPLPHAAFASYMFRPVTSTSIKVFEEMLNKVPNKKRESV